MFSKIDEIADIFPLIVAVSKRQARLIEMAKNISNLPLCLLSLWLLDSKWTCACSVRTIFVMPVSEQSNWQPKVLAFIFILTIFLINSQNLGKNQSSSCDCSHIQLQSTERDGLSFHDRYMYLISSCLWIAKSDFKCMCSKYYTTILHFGLHLFFFNIFLETDFQLHGLA